MLPYIYACMLVYWKWVPCPWNGILCVKGWTGMLLGRMLGIQAVSYWHAQKWLTRLVALGSGTAALLTAAEKKRKQQDEVRWCFLSCAKKNQRLGAPIQFCSTASTTFRPPCKDHMLTFVHLASCFASLRFHCCAQLSSSPHKFAQLLCFCAALWTQWIIK